MERRRESDESISERKSQQYKMPVAALSIMLALMGQTFATAFYAGSLTEKLNNVATVMNDTRKEVAEMRNTVPTVRDMEGVRVLIGDHESRLRLIEGGARGTTRP